ncbi:MAG TPA: hypothetical protein VG406_08830 [Isosphaeraceae bacterium]|jgi:hypothetical protein|nr:hypothetical protein [Isosphaeraceae bacterium]
MRRPGASTVGLLGVLLLAGLGFAALRFNSAIVAGVAFLATWTILALGAIGACCRPAGRQAGWIGFAAFGLGYMVLVFGLRNPSPYQNALPTTQLLEALRTRLEMHRPKSNLTYYPVDPNDHFLVLGHGSWALLAACVGGLTAHTFFGRGTFPSDVEARPAATAPAPMPPARGRSRRRRGLSILWWMGVVVLVALGLTALRNTSAIMASVVFLVTCGALGVALLGAFGMPAGRRLPWIGAALFGWGYMSLSFAWIFPYDNNHWEASPRPTRATTMLLEAAFRHVPFVRGGNSREDWSLNRRIEDALDKPASIRFAEPTPLEDVITTIRGATVGPDFPAGIPIWVDPYGLQEQDKTLESTVTLDHMEGAPLRTSLRLMLKQLDLYYVVGEGILKIISISDDDLRLNPAPPDDFLRIGHSLFALLAGCLGGLAGLVVGAWREKSAA